jgi:predicted AlkP superfamily pyrophosphatase or phosphodiesterase
MKRIKIWWILFSIISFTIGYCSISYAQGTKGQTTVVLSLDGFRWDYPNKISTPSLNRIAKEGVKAISLIPSFPSKTFPNHYTIATGLVPDHNGLVNNSFYDSTQGKSFSIGNNEARYDPDFYGGEPIWITAAQQGVRTASFYWVGSDAAIKGRHPDYWKSYDESIPFIARIDTIIKWLSLPAADRPRLVMAYYHEPDGVGHEYGPDDPRTLKMIHEIDSMTGILYDRLKHLPDGKNINLIVVSDHGMGAISSDRNVALRDYIPETWPVRIEGGNPNFNLYADKTWTDSAYYALKKVTGIKVWRPGDVPKYLNYGTNLREGTIIVVADSAWSLTLNRPKKEFFGGTHGYDIHDTDIHAIFYATGPAFKKNYIQPSFQNIHIYPLLAYLLGIKPAETDGDLQQVINMLKSTK